MNESANFRRRANECRELANAARNDVSRNELNDIASALDAEADKIDAEDPAQEAKPHP